MDGSTLAGVDIDLQNVIQGVPTGVKLAAARAQFKTLADRQQQLLETVREKKREGADTPEGQNTLARDLIVLHAEIDRMNAALPAARAAIDAALPEYTEKLHHALQPYLDAMGALVAHDLQLIDRRLSTMNKVDKALVGAKSANALPLGWSWELDSRRLRNLLRRYAHVETEG